MSLTKFQSVTTDTRHTNNQSYTTQQKKLAKQIIHSENCQLEFLRQKNYQLSEKVERMGRYITELEVNKQDLLSLNQRYVRTLNQYHRNKAANLKENNLKGRENRQKQDTKLVKKSTMSELQKDHRNLVQHCLSMQIQIKNYVKQMGRYNEMKKDLQSVSHTDTKQLIKQINLLTLQNIELKKQNNHLEFQLEKAKQQISKQKRAKQNQEGKAESGQAQLQRYRSLVNTTEQISIDKSRSYEAKIYDLQIKVQKLQCQLRNQQGYLIKNTEAKHKLQIAQVQHIEERQKLRKSLRDKRKQKGNLSLSFYR